MSILVERFRQKYRTMAFPDGPAPEPPDRWLGRPALDARACDSCGKCVGLCPSGALRLEKGQPLALDMGKCLFCGDCAACCEKDAVLFTRNHALAAVDRDELRVGGPATPSSRNAIRSSARVESERLRVAEEREVRLKLIRSRFKRSLKLRQVSAGGCNACEADANVLATVAWDIGRFGLGFVASPRHADGILVTGPVTPNMRLALEKTWLAVPEPRVVVATGACAVSGGLFRPGGGLDKIIPVDLYVPGCPPHPLVLLEGLLRLLGRV